MSALVALQKMMETTEWVAKEEHLYIKSGDQITESEEYLTAIQEWARYVRLFGTPFYWSPELVPLLDAAATDALDGLPWRPEELPAETGFLWFGKPLPITELMAGHTGRLLNGLSWYVLDGAVCFFAIADSEKFSDREAMGFMGGWKADGTLFGQIDQDRRLFRILAAAFIFMRQRVVTKQRQYADRAAKKWLPAIAHDRAIEVITLRRASKPTHNDEPSHVEWQTRWMVRGHWRQQWFPSLQDHRPVWIYPYVKGPESKPLKVPPLVVFEVKR